MDEQLGQSLSESRHCQSAVGRLPSDKLLLGFIINLNPCLAERSVRGMLRLPTRSPMSLLTTEYLNLWTVELLVWYIRVPAQLYRLVLATMSSTYSRVGLNPLFSQRVDARTFSRVGQSAPLTE